MVSLIWLFDSMPVLAAVTLGELSKAQVTDIAQQCTPLQFTQGVDAYRLCLLQKLEGTQRGDELGDATYSNLPVDELYAIQRACANERSISSTDYATCTRNQLSQMQQEPEPALSLITQDEQYVLAQQCFQTQTSSGARAYRMCVNTALASLDNLPKANFSARNNVESNNIQLECSISSGNVANYRKCLLNALGITFDQARTPAIPARSNAENQSESADAANGQVTDLPVLDTSAKEPAPDQVMEGSELPAAPLDIEEHHPAVPAATAIISADTDTASNSDEFANTTQKIKQATIALFDKLQARLLMLTPDSWVVLLAALSIPILFFCARSAYKANEKRSQLIASRPDLGPASSRATVLQPVNRDHTTKPDNDGLPALTDTEEPSRYHVPEPQLPAEDSSRSSNMSFKGWLKNFHANQQQEYTIEFLIYWMAYADNRFEPGLKQRVFEMTSPDIPNLIKRWVFKKDANAFADAIWFLQSNTNPAQRRQIINLLMALLVNENALTPAQNNLLRFFADAFGIGKTELNEQFIRAYGQLMPDVPRPDKVSWWDQISSEQKLRWDARAAARQPQHIRCRIALGQPLKGELEQVRIDNSFKFAMDRCSGEQVNLLGEREMSLLATQRKKFESARNTLLEPMT